METIAGLRYRAEDALRAVSKRAIKAARKREIEDEILNSEKLKVRGL
jgi:ATP-dependent RNA helicase DDX56/DBP9